MKSTRIAIVGAGPIGLEAACFSIESGFHTSVFERGRVGENLRTWGHVRLFSPLGMNVSDWSRDALAAGASAIAISDEAAIQTGREFVDRYLVPLSRLRQLQGCIQERTEVLSIGRSRTWKKDLTGPERRSSDPFQILLRDAWGERTVQADCVLDCSGTYGNHNWCGAGGIPCAGETDASCAIEYGLPDILGEARASYASRTTLVVGAGYSAATSVDALARLARSEPTTRVIWITRTAQSPPIRRIANDRLTERDGLAARANALATTTGGAIAWHPATVIRAIRPISGERFEVVCERASEYRPLEPPDASQRAKPPNAVGPGERLLVDRIVANVGYRPDRRLYEELHVHECYASQGPMKLAAALLGESSPDCLALPPAGGALLANPEPGFFIIGSKSYGRNSRFLLKTGLEQIPEVFSLIAREVTPA